MTDKQMTIFMTTFVSLMLTSMVVIIGANFYG